MRKTDESTKEKQVKVLNAQLTEMEFQNEQLKDEIEKLLRRSPIETFTGGRYSNNVREVYHYLTAQGISCRKVEPLIRMVLDKLANEEIDQLPKKSLTATMPAEADLLSKMHVGAILQNEPNSTLHIDGTTKKFSEYSTFNITTGSTGKSLSLGFVEQSGGTADDYIDSTRNIFHDIAKLLRPTDAKEDEVQHKCGELIMCLENLQTDQHIVKSNFQQLTEFRFSMLPAVMADYDSLSAEQLGNIVRMNHTFCGLHAVHNIGSTAKETLRELETLVGFQP